MSKSLRFKNDAFEGGMLLSTQLVPANPSSGVIIADYTLSSEAGFSMCGWVSLCEGLAVSPATPQSWLRKRRIPRWPSGAAPTADTHIHEHTETHTELPGSSTAGSNEGPIAGIQRTPHNCLTEKPKLLMGTTLIFPFLKEAFFPPLSLISKCLVFQNAHCVCVSDGLLWIKAFSADNKWFKCASHYSGWRWVLTGSFIFHSCSMVDSW